MKKIIVSLIMVAIAFALAACHKERADQAEYSLKKSKKKVSTLKYEISEKNRQIKVLEERTKNIKGWLKSSNDDKAKLRKELAAAKKELATLKSVKKKLDKTLASEMSKFKKLANRHQRLWLKYKDDEATHDVAAEQLNKYIEQVKAERNLARRKNKVLAKKLRQERSDILDLPPEPVLKK
jgi:septal ring factor EnvC (AmiA/AmiB activator)